MPCVYFLEGKWSFPVFDQVTTDWWSEQPTESPTSRLVDEAVQPSYVFHRHASILNTPKWNGVLGKKNTHVDPYPLAREEGVSARTSTALKVTVM